MQFAYTASTQARDSSKDISLGTGSWRGGVSDGTTLWFVENDNSIAIAYNASTQARDSSKDISLGTGSWNGGLSDGTTLWFVEDDNNNAVAYSHSPQTTYTTVPEFTSGTDNQVLTRTSSGMAWEDHRELQHHKLKHGGGILIQHLLQIHLV